jgi:hypothetical protein
MQMTGQALAGSTQTLTTKKGDQLQKSKLKVLDIGSEASGGDIYWIDFLGEAAMSEEELEAVLRQQVVVEVRRMYASPGKREGVAYLNAAGGAVKLNGQVVQRTLRTQYAKQTQQQRAS